MNVNDKNRINTAFDPRLGANGAASRVQGAPRIVVDERTRPQGGQTGAQSSSFERELRSRLAPEAGQSSSTNAGQRTQEQKSSRAFNDLLNGVKGTRASGAFAPEVGGKSQSASQARERATQASQSSIDSVFWQRDQIDDAVFHPGSAASTRTGVNREAFTNMPTSRDASARASMNLQAPETRASLLNIVRAQEPGRTLNLFA